MSLPTAHSGSQAHVARNVEDITKEAQEYDYDASISIKKWLRTAHNILRQAEVYGREGNDEETYFLLFRHAHLVLTNIAVHPEARIEPYRRAVAEQEQLVKSNLRVMEALKPRINKRYERYQEIYRQREAYRASAQRQPSAPHTPFIDDHIQTLEPRENGELAVRLAQKEARRRSGAYTAGQYRYDREDQRRMREPLGGRSYEYSDDVKDDLSRRLQEVRARVDRPYSHTDSRASQSSVEARHANYCYPSVPPKGALSQPWQSSLSPPSPRLPSYQESSYGRPPSRPPKQSLNYDQSITQPPSIPSKDAFISPSPPPKSETPPSSNYRFKTAATTESGAPLRTLFLPPALRHRFLQIAQPNTRRNLETCGILAGSLISNALIISHLVIPSQNSTTDTCEMEDESSLFDFVDQQDLMVFGWIHTHPTQTCFMSSRDLHTQSGYQVMLPESIAIVCAPSQHTQQHHANGGYENGYDSDGDWGCFRLTDPPGLKSILSCTKEGLFHPHEVQNIYTGALRPGHVVEAKGLDFKVVDLREK